MLSTEEFRAEQAAGTNGIFQVPTTGSAESVTGNIIRTGTTFLLGQGGFAKGGGVLANVGASGVSGALMDPREPRLSNLIDSVAPNFITDWLKARPDQEPGMLDRLKSAAEYAGLDLGFAGVTRVLRSVKDAVTNSGVSGELDATSGAGAPQAADAIARGEQATPGVPGEAAGAPPSDTTPAPQGNTAAPGGSSWVSRVPSAQEVRAPFQAADEPAADALIDKLRPIVQLPKYDELKNKTSGVFLTSDGRIIEWTSGDADAYRNYVIAAHPEGKSALFMRRDGLPYGIVFHNNPKGTCGYCDRMLETLLPEGAKLWTVPPPNAKAPTKSWIAVPKLYTGNSVQPLPPKVKE